jgi:predicted CoA-binding protein
MAVGVSQEQEIDRSADRQGVQIFRKTDEAPAVADEAIKAGARVLWLHSASAATRRRRPATWAAQPTGRLSALRFSVAGPRTA